MGIHRPPPRPRQIGSGEAAGVARGRVATHSGSISYWWTWVGARRMRRARGGVTHQGPAWADRAAPRGGDRPRACGARAARLRLVALGRTHGAPRGRLRVVRAGGPPERRLSLVHGGRQSPAQRASRAALSGRRRSAVRPRVPDRLRHGGAAVGHPGRPHDDDARAPARLAGSVRDAVGGARALDCRRLRRVRAVAVQAAALRAPGLSGDRAARGSRLAGPRGGSSRTDRGPRAPPGPGRGRLLGRGRQRRPRVQRSRVLRYRRVYAQGGGAWREWSLASVAHAEAAGRSWRTDLR